MCLLTEKILGFANLKICSKASRQISALQRLTGLFDFPSRKAIYNSFISSYFNHCPLVCFFTSKVSIAKLQKTRERALRFVLKDSFSDYETLLAKSGVDSFRIATIKIMAVEIYKILNDMGPDHLSRLFSKSNNHYQIRDDNNLIQPLKRTYTFGMKSIAYFGTHLWNMLPTHITTRCLCMVLIHWYVNGRVLHVVALSVRKSFDLFSVAINLYIMAYGFIILLGYIWENTVTCRFYIYYTHLFSFTQVFYSYCYL